MIATVPQQHSTTVLSAPYTAKHHTYRPCSPNRPSWFLGSHAPLLPRGGEGESSARSPPFPRGYLWFFGLSAGSLRCIGYLSCPSVCLSVRTFFGATTRQRPSYLIKTPHHHHHNTTEEEDRADNTPSPPPLAALFVGGGGGGGRRREEKKKRKNILYARNAFFCMMYSISVSEPNIPI